MPPSTRAEAIRLAANGDEKVLQEIERPRRLDSLRGVAEKRSPAKRVAQCGIKENWLQRAKREAASGDPQAFADYEAACAKSNEGKRRRRAEIQKRAVEGDLEAIGRLEVERAKHRLRNKRAQNTNRSSSRGSNQYGGSTTSTSGSSRGIEEVVPVARLASTDDANDIPDIEMNNNNEADGPTYGDHRDFTEIRSENDRKQIPRDDARSTSMSETDGLVAVKKEEEEKKEQVKAAVKTEVLDIIDLTEDVAEAVTDSHGQPSRDSSKPQDSASSRKDDLKLMMRKKALELEMLRKESEKVDLEIELRRS